MPGVFRNIDPSPSHPLLSPHGECVPPAFGAGGGRSRWVERGGGSIVRKTADTALYSVLNICKYFLHIYLLGWSSDHQSLL
jgi:hypothetical protein